MESHSENFTHNIVDARGDAAMPSTPNQSFPKCYISVMQSFTTCTDSRVWTVFLIPVGRSDLKWRGVNAYAQAQPVYQIMSVESDEGMRDGRALTGPSADKSTPLSCHIDTRPFSGSDARGAEVKPLLSDRMGGAPG